MRNLFGNGPSISIPSSITKVGSRNTGMRSERFSKPSIRAGLPGSVWERFGSRPGCGNSYKKSTQIPGFRGENLCPATTEKYATSGQFEKRCIAKCFPGFTRKPPGYWFIYAWRAARFGRGASEIDPEIAKIFRTGWMHAD